MDEKENNPTVNTNYYDDMVAQAIANGKGNGKTDPYSNYTNAQNKSQSLLDYYNANKANMTTNQVGAMTTLMDNASQQEQAAKSYYNQFLENQRGAESAKVAAYNAQQQALKYTQNSLAAQGLGSQGVAQSTMAGIGNNYSNIVAAANIARDRNNSTLLGQYQDALNSYNNKAIQAVNVARAEDDATLGDMFSNDISDALATADFTTAKNIMNDPKFNALAPNTQREVSSTYNQLVKAAYSKIIGTEDEQGSLKYANVSQETKNTFLNGMVNGDIKPNTYVVLESTYGNTRNKNIFYIDEKGRIQEKDYSDVKGKEVYYITKTGSAKTYTDFKRNWLRDAQGNEKENSEE